MEDSTPNEVRGRLGGIGNVAHVSPPLPSGAPRPAYLNAAYSGRTTRHTPQGK